MTLEPIQEKTSLEPVMRDVTLLVSLAALYRLVFLWAMPRVLDTADAIHYIETARHLAQGDFWGFDPKIPILYPLLSTYAHMLFSDWEWAATSVSFLASILVIVPVYFLARAMHGRAAAVLSGITVAIWPWLADYGCRVGTESLASLWWFLGVWLLFLAVQKNSFWLLPAFLTFFALHLTRPEGMFLMLATPVATILLHEKKDWRLKVQLPCLILLIIMGLSVYTFYIRRLTGSITPNYRIGFILREFDMTRFVHTTFSTLTDVLPVMLGPVLMLFLGVGLFAVRASKRDIRLELFVLFFIFLQWFVSLFVLSPAPRYLMCCIIALATWSAYGIVLVSSQAASMRFGALLRLLPAGVLIASMLLHTGVTVGSEYMGRPPREPREYKIAGHWLKEHAEPGLIFCRKPQVGYYADMPSTGPDLNDTLEQAITRAQTAGAKYIVVDERYTAQDVPGLRVLLDPSQAPPSLQFLYETVPYPRCRVVIYALQKPSP
ncbi:MAG TPA: glycosyltransferase family 39 protein [Candidatus Hydrogenedentes bacterium]|nr:glycosyltransferase family 39 protein [Candidatus Hydrogenedentota bacterium]